ncbi:MAG: glutamine-hydrolyzing GMP synthase [Spirochaeta sp. LUC14_002_19_P3]|nr:MAG: glutamine-hydrolyzing GMP synthase [Spirochaeta sp. LUC14_002_19_P3]
MDSILILDFGGQTTQLIGRRIRDIGVYTEIAPGACRLSEVLSNEMKGIILSGSPLSAWKEDSLKPDPAVLNCGLPVLGICYGFHQLAILQGGKANPLPCREYGRSRAVHNGRSPLFAGVKEEFSSWMSHGDSVTRLGGDFQAIAQSENGLIAAAAHETLPLFGVQFHPEASHCEEGSHILENFAVGICGCRKQWSLESCLEEQTALIRERAGSGNVLLLISGGVDSTVAAALLLRALPPKQVWLMYIDTGLMRKGETKEVEANLKLLGAENLLIINAEECFLSALKGLNDPEEKRRAIGDTFIQVQQAEIARHIPPDYLLAQGTLYTDLIESGKGVGGQAEVIKSHHNVSSPLVQAKRDAGELLEPLSRLYKDEVRRLGELLGINPAIVARHPFPGPGLAIRILSGVSKEKLSILREADALYISELKARGLYGQIWQAFCILLPVRSVGVTGDAREYSYVLALRAVVSRDGMSADVFDFPMKDLLEISAKITNAVKQVGRVVYDVSSKPPATIEWE